jgi:hypothetical protein
MKAESVDKHRSTSCGISLRLMMLVIPLMAAQARCVELPTYPTRYYIIHTDLDRDGVREAVMRMTHMAEEYRRRTSDFAGTIDRRMDFYLFKNHDDCLATGAPKGSAGYFDGTKLVALAGDLGPRTWHTVQHEGFHQFARFMIRGDMPAWLNEGLAEYFAEGAFTGDEFITGLIPQARLDRIQKALKQEQFKPINDLMSLSLDEWNSQLAVLNYDQGWTLVQFLAHGENAKYQPQFQHFIGGIGNELPWEFAWRQELGDPKEIEKPWRDYWANLPANPTVDLYAQANVSTLASFFGRALARGQRFADFGQFLLAAKQKQLQSDPAEWLPPSLLSDALEQQAKLSSHGFEYAIERRPGEARPQIACKLPDGRKAVGRFTVAGGKLTVKSEILPKGR